MTESDPALPDYLGSRQSALGLVLAFFGAGTLVALMVVTPQMLAEPDWAESRPWIVAIGCWGIIAAWLGLRLRKGEAGSMSILFARLWLAPALAFGAWATFQ